MTQDMLDRAIELRRRGQTSAWIATNLGVSERTVKKYLRGAPVRLERKLGLERGELMTWFVGQLTDVFVRRFGWSLRALNWLVLQLRERMRLTDDLVVERLRVDEEVRSRFLTEFEHECIAKAIASHRPSFGPWQRRLEQLENGYMVERFSGARRMLPPARV